MNVTWLALNSSYSHAPLGLPLLHACSTAAGATWRAVKAITEDSVQAVTAEVLAQAPDVLLATAYLFNVQPLLAVIRRVRRVRPDCRVILGGPEFLGSNEVFLRRETAVTAVIRGEGERVLPPLLKALVHGRDLPALPGLCRIAVNGIYEDHGTAEPADLRTLPLPEDSPFFDWDKPFVLLETSRGCSGHCTYCTSCGSSPLRQAPLARVREQLLRFREHHVREVRVLDRTFNAKGARCGELLELFAQFQPMRFHVEVHPAQLGLESRRAFAAAPAGQLQVEAGLQSGTAAVRALVNRRGGPDKEWSGISFLCGCSGLSVHVDLLAGLPAQTLDDVVADVKQLAEAGPEEIQLELLKILPGTPLAEQCDELGVLAAQDPPYEVLQTRSMSPADLERARMLSRMVDVFHNHTALRPAFRAALGEDTSFLERFLDSLVTSGALQKPASLENRFRLFHAYARERLPQTETSLVLAWLRQNLSPAHGLRPATPWKGPVPGGAEPLGDVPDRLDASRARTWHVVLHGFEYWFLTDRGGARTSALFRRAVP